MVKRAFRLLIADDEYWVRQAIAGLVDWEQHGFYCLPPAVDGEDAWAKIQSEKPDIVLLDIDMPFVSGVELTRRIREQYPNMVVIILSGYSDFHFVREALMNGAVEYLLKPAEREKLLQALSLGTEQLLRRCEEYEQLMVLREQSELAGSMLQDRELSEMLRETAASKGEPSANYLQYDMQFTSYHLVQIQLGRLWADAKGIHALKGRIAALFEAKHQLVFHDVVSQGTFYWIGELDQQVLHVTCQNAMKALESEHAESLTILASRRKTSFRQLKAALNELRQLRLVRPCAKRNQVLCAWAQQSIPVYSRISAQQRRELEAAANARSRALFRQVLDGQIGLRQGMEGGWLQIELLHTLSAVGHILQGALPREATGGQSATVDNLMELMLVAADRMDGEEALSILNEMQREAFGTEGEAAASEDMRGVVRQVCEYIAQQFGDELSLSILARRFAVDDAHLSRVFKQIIGENLMLHIARTRIERAQEYIRQGNWSLTEIAAMTGYEDYAYFNRVFRRITDKSPSAYREECSQ